MSRKQVVILWVIAVILAASAVVVKTRSAKGFDSHTARARGQTLFTDFPVKEVARVKITSGKETVTLARKGDNWVVADRADYPANVANLSEFLRLVAQVKVVEGVESEPSFAPRFGMEVNSDKPDEQGTEVVFSNDAGTQIASATFGKKLGSSESSEQGGVVGRFIRNNADATGVYKVSELFPTLSATPSAWLDQQFLTIEKIKDIAVSKPGKPENDWTLTRPDEDAEFTLVDKQTTEPLDPAVTGALKTLFSSSTLTDIVLPDKVAESEDPATKRTVEINTTEGFNYKLTIAQGTTTETKPDENGQPPEGGYLVTVDVTGTLPAERKKGDKESEADAKAKDAAFTDRKSVLEKRLADQKSLAGRTFKVSSWTVEAVVKNRSELIKKPTPPAGQAGRGPQGLQGLQSLQGLQGIPGMPPQGGGAPARRPVQAVTPPVAIPPSEDDGGGEDGQ